MSKTLSLASLSALLLAACVITDDDDDAGDTSSGASTTQTTSSTSASTTSSTTASTTDVSTGESTAADSTSAETTAETAAETSTGAGACGWGPTGEKTTPFGYICDGEGADPDGMIEMDCPAIELVEDGDCGGESGITGAGCCDANGDVWYCADDTQEPRLHRLEC